MKIAVLYICTGKYEMFWDEFYKTCQQHFYKNHNVEYIVFTDSKRIIESKEKNVHTFFQRKAGWPYDTMLRFQWFASVQDKLREYDYCYYLNANSIIKYDIDEELIPFPNLNSPLIFWCHTNYYKDNTGNTFNPERNPESTAYVPYNSACRCYGGGFFGGCSEAFVTLCTDLRDAIQKDLRKGIIAIWHDQSHIIKYATNHVHLEVAQNLISEEEYITDVEKCAIVFLAKSKFGGNDVLREVDIKTKINHLPRKIYSRLLNMLNGTILEKGLRTVVKRVKRK